MLKLRLQVFKQYQNDVGDRAGRIGETYRQGGVACGTRTEISKLETFTVSWTRYAMDTLLRSVPILGYMFRFIIIYQLRVMQWNC
jgi:hypothetical protein